jgi:hypothetical protein
MIKQCSRAASNAVLLLRNGPQSWIAIRIRDIAYRAPVRYFRKCRGANSDVYIQKEAQA